MARSFAFVGVLAAAVVVVFLWLRADGRTPRTQADGPAATTSPPADEGGRIEPTREVLPEAQPQATREAIAPVPAAAQGTSQREAPLAKSDGLAITGKVVDDLGTPIPEFSIEIARPGAKWNHPLGKIDVEGFTIEGIDEASLEQVKKLLAQPSGSGNAARRFASPDGTFSLDGLAPGQVLLTARAATERRSAPAVVDVDDGAEGVTLVVPRSATLVGVVADATGAPVFEAGVFLLAAGEEEFHLDDPAPQARTDASGGFILENVVAGAVQFMARHPRYSESEWMKVTVAPGELRSDIQIVLTSGGRIEGFVDPSLGDVADRQVDLFSFRGTIGWRETRTDATGRFVIEGVIPQDYVIELRPAGYGQPGFEHQDGIRKNIKVVEGETTQVMFGGTTKKIAVRGTITARGQPVSGLDVRANSREGGEDRGERFRTGSDGMYELTVDGPGLYVFTVSFEDDSHAGFQRSVPDEPAVELDLEVPSGSISGRISDAGGKPLARVPVSLVREAEASETGTSFWSRFSRLRTRSDGSFEFRLLNPGTYTLRAPDGYWDDSPPPRVPHGRMLRTGLLLDDGHSITGLKIRLAEEGRVSGQVVDLQGNAVGGARIVLEDLAGWSISAYWEIQTDATGHFDVLSVAPGTYTTHARAAEKEADSDPFVVEAGRTATTKVVMP